MAPPGYQLNPYTAVLLDPDYGAPYHREAVLNRLTVLRGELQNPLPEAIRADVLAAVRAYELLLMPNVDGDGI